MIIGLTARRLLLVASLALAGCSSAPERPLPSTADSGPQMVPVQLFISFEDKEYIHPQKAADVEHLRKTIVESGLFLETRNPGSPYAVKITYSLDDGSSTVAGFSLFMLRAATLFLIPFPQECEYKLDTTVYYRGSVVTTRTYTAKNSPAWVMFNLNLHHGGIELVFREMEQDFRAMPPLPLAVPPAEPVAAPPPTI